MLWIAGPTNIFNFFSIAYVCSYIVDVSAVVAPQYIAIDIMKFVCKNFP